MARQDALQHLRRRACSFAQSNKTVGESRGVHVVPETGSRDAITAWRTLVLRDSAAPRLRVKQDGSRTCKLTRSRGARGETMKDFFSLFYAAVSPCRRVHMPFPRETCFPTNEFQLS